VPAVELAVAVTFKLSPPLVGSVRARAAAEATTISNIVSGALRAFLGEADGNGWTGPAEMIAVSILSMPSTDFCWSN
jgi:hypothetical protein